MGDIADLRATYIASASLANDLRNLKRAVDKAPPLTRVEETKQWAFVGHMGRRVLVDRRVPCPPTRDNPTYCASSTVIGERATEINPATGQHSYDTGNLYRTVHWTSDTFGLNGTFTTQQARGGPWRQEGLNTSATRNRVLSDPTQWGSSKEVGGFL